MTGIQYIIDEKGDRTAVLIDLKKYKSEWEEFYDSLIAKSRSHEPRMSLEDVKSYLKNTGKLNEHI